VVNVLQALNASQVVQADQLPVQVVHCDLSIICRCYHMLPRDDRHPCAQHAVLLRLLWSPTCSNDANQKE